MREHTRPRALEALEGSRRIGELRGLDRRNLVGRREPLEHRPHCAKLCLYGGLHDVP
jgi:hypothetical protein